MAHPVPAPPSPRALRTRDFIILCDTLRPNQNQLTLIQAVVDGCRTIAGPQLHPDMPPHHAPGGSFQHPQGGLVICDTPPGWVRAPAADQLWSGWIRRHGPDKSIPLLIPSERVPSGDTTDQHLVNDFLRRLQTGVRDQVRSERPGDAPSILLSEVSSSDDANREREFESERRAMPSGPPQVFVSGTDMKLVNYSMTVKAAKGMINRTRGTLALVASRDRITPSENTILRRLASYLPGLTPTNIDAATKRQAQDEPLWHNTAVLALSIGRGTHREVTGIYIYDPSFVNENPSSRVVSTSIQRNGIAGRLGDHLLITNAARLAREWQGKSGISIFIGGGGNTAGVDECRRMSCNWMQQAGWLLARVADEEIKASGDGNHQDARGWKDAVDDIRAFLQNFIKVTI